MKPQIKILTGTRQGHTEVFSKPYLGLGRHPASDIQFDPERELEVSARHAALIKQNVHWYVRDLGSRNGTLVNGHKISGDVTLDDTDQIKLGPDGPTIEFRLVPDDTPDGIVARASRASAPQAVRPLDATIGPGGRARASTTSRIRVEVGRQTKKLQVVVGTLAVVLVAAAAAFLVYSRQLERVREQAIAAMQSRTDSILREAESAVRTLQGQVEGLAQALRQSQIEVESLQLRLATARRSGDAGQVDLLQRELADVTQVLRYQQAAATVDYRGIVDANQRAIGMLYVEFGPGHVFTGTAFAVRPDGTMLTNRHVVTGENGQRRPVRMGVQFADSDQFFPAQLVAVSDEVDLAVIKVTVRGGVPTVAGLNAQPDTVRQGDPVAIIGFPLGTDLPMSASGSRTILRTTFTAGTVSKVLAERLQIDGYGAQGSSGSPIFDRGGQVVGILFGGQPGSEGRIVYSVPATYAIRLLERVG